MTDSPLRETAHTSILLWRRHLIETVFVNVVESILSILVLIDCFVVNDALSFVNVALVAIKAVDTGLHSLLNHEFLQKNVLLAPTFSHVRQ